MIVQPICHFSGAADPWFRNGDGQADVNYFFGVNPIDVYRTGEPASGNIVGASAGNILSSVGSPTYRQTLTGGGDDPLGAGFTDNSTDSFAAANATVHDFTFNYFILFSWRSAGFNSSLRHLIGKRDTAGLDPGYAFFISASLLRHYVDDGASLTFVSLAYDNDTTGPHYAAIWQTSTLVGISSDYGTDTGVARNVTNSVLFSLGAGYLNAAAGTIGPVVVLTGSDAQINAAVAGLPAWALAAGVF